MHGNRLIGKLASTTGTSERHRTAVIRHSHKHSILAGREVLRPMLTKRKFYTKNWHQFSSLQQIPLLTVVILYFYNTLQFSKFVSCKQIVSAILSCKQILLQTSAAWKSRRHIQLNTSQTWNRNGTGTFSSFIYDSLRVAGPDEYQLFYRKDTLHMFLATWSL